VENFRLIDTPMSDIPGFHCKVLRPVNLQSLMHTQGTFITELGQLIEGNTPVEFSVEMHNCLVSYVVAFERYEKFKPVLKRRWAWHGIDAHTDLDCTHGPRCGALDADALYSGADYINDALISSKAAAEGFDALRFKNYQAFILGHLEAQFKEIVAGSTKIIEYIKEQKRGGGLLSIERRSDDYSIPRDIFLQRAWYTSRTTTIRFENFPKIRRSISASTERFSKIPSAIITGFLPPTQLLWS
jgi:hypothetical protein